MKVPIRMTEILFGIVIEKRSVNAASARQSGNTRKIEAVIMLYLKCGSWLFF